MSLQLASDFHGNPAQYQHVDLTVLERLAKALVEAGVNPEKLDRRAENEKRLAIVARLFELPISQKAEAQQEQPSRRATSALPKWRMKRVVEFVQGGDDVLLVPLQPVGIQSLCVEVHVAGAIVLPDGDHATAPIGNQGRIERESRMGAEWLAVGGPGRQRGIDRDGKTETERWQDSQQSPYRFHDEIPSIGRV